MARVILHIDLNAFFASCEEIKNPDLKEFPVAVGSTSKRGVISTANYEARKYGVRVTNIHPEMTDTDLYRNADFEADTEFGCSLTSSLIAETVLNVLKSPEGFSVNDITINPQYHRLKRK